MSKHALQGILDNRHRVAIGATVDEIVVNPGDAKAFELFDVVDSPAETIEHEVVSGFGGMTQERTLGTEGKAVSGVSSTGKIFKPGNYQEHHKFTEADLLKLRKFGTIGERGLTGLTDGELNMMSMIGKKLDIRLKNRLQQLVWDAWLNGRYTFKGVTFDFGVPTANNLTAGSDWSDTANSDPLQDLDVLFTSNELLLKYKWKELMMNPVTGSLFRRALMKKYGVNNINVQNASVTELAKFYVPELPPIEIVKDMWQDDQELADGSIVAGPAQYFLPNDIVLPVQDLSSAAYQKFGQIEVTENLNDPSATIAKPATGIYTFIDEEGLRNKAAPHVKLYAGFNGGANLKRPNDIFKINV